MTEQHLIDEIRLETNTRRIKSIAENATKTLGDALAGGRVYAAACERLYELQTMNIRPLRSSMSRRERGVRDGL